MNRRTRPGRATGRRLQRGGALLLLTVMACTPLVRRPKRAASPTSWLVPATGPTVVVAPMDPPPEPEPAPSDSAGVARIVRLATVWHLASLHHPAAAVGGAPLDSAFIRAVTLVREASTADALASAYSRFLAALGDPLTRVERDTVLPADATVPRVDAERTADGILVLRLPTATHYDASADVTVRAALEAPPARVVLDLRASAPADIDSVEALVVRTQLVERLASIPFPRSSVRTRRIGGARWADGAWRFDDAWLDRDDGVLLPERTTPRRVMVLANAQSVLPRAVLGLVASARATLIAEGMLRDDALVPSVQLPIGHGLVVRLRTGELRHADGSSGVVPDTTVVAASAPADSAPVLRAAMALLRANRAPRAFRFPVVRGPAVLPPYYDRDPYPFMGARLLGGARLWSAMRARHAHRDLYDDDIDAQFARAIPQLEAARTAGDYAMALRQFAASFDDAAVQLRGPSIDAVRGVASAPFRARLIDGRAVIVDVLADSAARGAGLERGQEILAVDGFPIPAWLAEHRRDVSAPNEAARADLLLRGLSRGAEGPMLLRLREASGRERAVTVMRRADLVPLLPAVERPAAAAAQARAGGLAYLDVDHLTDQTVEEAIAAHRRARGWILDLRGRLPDGSGVGDRLLAALRARPEAVVARELHRYQRTPCLAATLRDAAQQCPDEWETRPRISRGDTTGRVAARLVALIDERTSGAMERLALALQATTDVTFLGSGTAGSPAEAVSIALPGGVQVAVPAAELRRIDGSPWQRVGLSPVIDVRQTVRGLRSGTDEVIERAHEWLVQQLDNGRRRR